MNKNILIIANHEFTLYNFRLELLKEFLNTNHKIIILCPKGDNYKLFEDLGCDFLDLKLSRKSKNPFKELQTIFNIRKTIKMYNPKYILTFTVKPNLYTAIINKNNRQIANITGFGDSMSKENHLKKIIEKLYRKTFSNIHYVFFQNSDNMNYFLNKIIKLRTTQYDLLPGSGVNIDKFLLSDYPKNNKIKILYMGRITKNKGIDELLDAVEFFQMNDKLEFVFVGDIDDIDIKGKFLKYYQIFNFKYYEHQKNIHEFIEKSDVVILPSYHEGMSNSLLEAAAVGRPLLASNIPGCKEIVIDGNNGYLFEPKSSVAIIEAIIKFINLDWTKRKSMGLFSRKHVVENFDRNIVVKKYLEKIEEM